jgi:hypothetical protein
LILGRQARIAARDAQDANIGRDRANAAHIGCRQCRVELLVYHIRAAEEFAAIGRGHDLELLALSEMRAWRAIGIDDAFGQKVEHPLVPALRLVGCEEVIEAPVLADDDDNVLDWRGGLQPIRCGIGISAVDRKRNPHAY